MEGTIANKLAELEAKKHLAESLKARDNELVKELNELENEDLVQ